MASVLGGVELHHPDTVRLCLLALQGFLDFGHVPLVWMSLENAVVLTIERTLVTMNALALADLCYCF